MLFDIFLKDQKFLSLGVEFGKIAEIPTIFKELDRKDCTM
jgi:hypothetical protein